MTLEIALRSPSLLPRFLQAGGDEPHKAHWVGSKPFVNQNQDQGGNNNETPKRKDSRGYRDISTITLGEVDQAFKFFANQLILSPYPSWIAPNYFCTVHLIEKDSHPPVVFGRIKTCYPGDGQIQNIREMELSFPRMAGKPDTILLHAGDILSAESYCVRVKFQVTEEEAAEFAARQDLFIQQGFVPELSAGYIDLLEANEQNHVSLPWMYVIGSRWFASIPESVRPEITEKLAKFIHWNKLIFNYHPEHLGREFRTLNRELGYKAGFTDHVLIEPENPQQAFQIVSKTFDVIFKQGMR